MPANLENSAVAILLLYSSFPGLEKIDFHSNPKESLCQRMFTIALISHASKVMLKILQARLRQYMNYELPDVQSRFIKGRGTRHPIANIHWIIKKQKSSRKISTSALLICQCLWLCGSQQTVVNFSRDGNTRSPDLPPQKSVCRSGRSSS